jgi:deoxyribonuclease-4
LLRRKLMSSAWPDGGVSTSTSQPAARTMAAIARHLDRIAQLWDAIGEYGPGFCLDTCHAHAGGEDLTGIVDRVKAITGRVDLIHANDSRDAFDSGADRHTNIGTGFIEPEAIAAIVRAAGCDVLVETPAAGQAEDISYLRSKAS